jgi:hypothetical protein
MDLLSVTNNKHVGAASVFADLAGFTAYIDAADTPEKQEEALRVLPRRSEGVHESYNERF